VCVAVGETVLVKVGVTVAVEVRVKVDVAVLVKVAVEPPPQEETPQGEIPVSASWLVALVYSQTRLAFSYKVK